MMRAVLLLAMAAAPLPLQDADPVDDSAIKVMTLEHGDCRELADLMMQLFHNEDVTVTSNARTNSLICKGSDETLKVIEALLLRLDEPSSRSRQPGIAGPGVTGPGPGVVGRPAGAVSGLFPGTAVAPTVVGSLTGPVRVSAADAEVERLAATCRELASRSTKDNPALMKAKDKLEAAIEKAFDQRQDQRREEVDRLKARLDRVEQTLVERDRSKSQIIKTRIDYLLDPDYLATPRTVIGTRAPIAIGGPAVQPRAPAGLAGPPKLPGRAVGGFTIPPVATPRTVPTPAAGPKAAPSPAEFMSALRRTSSSEGLDLRLLRAAGEYRALQRRVESDKKQQPDLVSALRQKQQSFEQIRRDYEALAKLLELESRSLAKQTEEAKMRLREKPAQASYQKRLTELEERLSEVEARIDMHRGVLEEADTLMKKPEKSGGR